MTKKFSPLASSFSIGTAGLTIPPLAAEYFPSTGTHLQRYAQVFNAGEINTSFYRNHRPDTYRKWADSVPDNFKFSVKLLRTFTQEQRLKETGPILKEVLTGISLLGKKWGVLLIQLPPSLAFHAKDAHNFLSAVRDHYAGAIALEPRHLSWISGESLELMDKFAINKVWADPERCPFPTDIKLKTKVLSYYRLHGTPEIYKSQYTQEFLVSIKEKMDGDKNLFQHTWCIFDNTTFGYATLDALSLMHMGQNKRS